MIEWFTYVQVAVACVAGLIAVVLGLAGKKPADLTNGATALVEVLLLVQLIIAIFSPLAGNTPTGSSLEFWVYLITALLLPPLAIFWGLVERNRWSTVILGVSSFAVAVMVFRMHQIWFVQLA